MSKEQYYESAAGFKDWALHTVYYFKLATGAIAIAGCVAYLIMLIVSDGRVLQAAL